MALQAEQAVAQRVVALLLEQRDRQEFALGFGHFAAGGIQVHDVHPVVAPVVADVALGLRDLVRVVREGVVDAAAVDVQILAEVLHRDAGALDVPAGVADAPRGIPLERLILKLGLGEPEHKVVLVALIAVFLDAFADADSEIVRVVDEADGINLRTRIVSVEKSDAQGDPGSVTVTIANKSKDIAGSISELQNRALINETYAQGATNQQIYNFTDNADATHPATLKLYISDSVVRINKMLLNIQFEAFRAYEKAIGGGGGQTTSSGGGQTTSSGGGSTTSSGGGSTTSSGGGTTSSSTSLRSSNTINSSDNGGSGGENHNHGLARGDRLALIDYNNNIIGGVNFVPSGAHTHPGHTHTVGSHTHSVSAHTHSVSAHTHTVRTPITARPAMNNGRNSRNGYPGRNWT